MSNMQYSIQCDILRINHEKGEAYWQEMMANSMVISDNSLPPLDAVKLLDEGETLREWTENCLLEDASASWYMSTICEEPVIFFQAAGFEFIFMSEESELRLGIQKPAPMNKEGLAP